MKRFIQRFGEKITGILSGFDRLVLRGTLRPISYARGMRGFLWHKQILFKDFGRFVENTTNQLREASCRTALARKRPILYLRSCRTDKHALAQEIAAKDSIDKGLVAVFSCVEPCMSYAVSPDRRTGHVHLELRPRKCIFLYHYLIDPEFGFMHARIQTWFPFSIQICLNGREWLSRQMNRAGLQYDRLENCFPWIEDFAKAQKLMSRQLTTSWPAKLDRFARMLNPIHDRIFEGFPLRYYWSAIENEWATDIVFKSASALGSIYPALILHAMTTFSSHDVMRFLGRKINGNFHGEVVTDVKYRLEGVRIKHRAGKNSLKLYDKFGRVLRTELTMNKAQDFKAFRPRENDPGGKCRWRPLRQGVADLHRRAEVSQAANERYLDALTATDTSIQLGDLVHSVCTPTSWKGKRVRALRPWAPDDMELLRAVNNGKFSINGFRNRDLQDLLYKTAPRSAKEKKRRSARVSRLLRMLRAHHLIQKVSSTYRYVITQKGSQIVTAILTAHRVTLDQLNQLAA
jgi:hypothetical protein